MFKILLGVGETGLSDELVPELEGKFIELIFLTQFHVIRGFFETLLIYSVQLSDLAL